MAVFIFLLVWNVGLSTAQTPQPTYHIPVIPEPIPSKEEFQYFEVPFPTTKLQVAQPGAKFMAHLFAGKAEYPFVVRIKANDYAPCEDPADAIYRQAMGMLITSDFILTACRPVSYLTCEERNKSNFEEWPTKGDPLPNPSDANPYAALKVIPIFPGSDKVDRKTFQCPSKDLRITPCAPNIFVVKYATVFLHEDNKYTDRFGHYSRDITNQFSGERHVAEVILHPECKTWLTLEKDVALLKLTAPINPAGTWVGFPTFPLNAQGRIERWDIFYKERICYIAGFNEDYAGMLGEEQITRHYKVKFRVYPADMAFCKSFIKIICFDKQLAIMKACLLWIKKYEKWVEELNDDAWGAAGVECWGTRHKVGAICDSHAGSPLVCEGITHGYVIRGADWQRCNNLYKMPILIARIHPFQDFFNEQLLGRTSAFHSLLFRPEDQPTHYHTYSRSSIQSGNELWLLMWVVIYNLLSSFFEHPHAVISI